MLSVFSQLLRPYLTSSCCTTPTLFLPDCSSSIIKDLLNIITKGFTDNISDFNNLVAAGQYLGIVPLHVNWVIDKQVVTENSPTKTPDSPEDDDLEILMIDDEFTDIDTLETGEENEDNTTKNLEKEQDRPFSCNKCNKTFPFKRNLIKHENVHSEKGNAVAVNMNKKKPQITCCLCGEGFESSAYLVKHLKTVVHDVKRSIQ